jgi:hypothetical protein
MIMGFLHSYCEFLNCSAIAETVNRKLSSHAKKCYVELLSENFARGISKNLPGLLVRKKQSYPAVSCRQITLKR